MHTILADCGLALNYLLRWFSFHRFFFMFMFGLFLWLAAYYLYFGKSWHRAWERRGGQSWSVDLARRKSSPSKVMWQPKNLAKKPGTPKKPK